MLHIVFIKNVLYRYKKCAAKKTTAAKMYRNNNNKINSDIII